MVSARAPRFRLQSTKGTRRSDSQRPSAVSILESRHPATGQPVRIAFVQVGALLVASIRQTARPGQTLKRGDEVGYFAYGGSTIVAVFPPGCVEWNEDLLSNSEGRNSRGAQLETLVKVSRIAPALFSTSSTLSKQTRVPRPTVCSTDILDISKVGEEIGRWVGPV